jgi:hypothetical protein
MDIGQYMAALRPVLSLVSSCEVLLSQTIHAHNVERQQNKRGKSLLRGSVIRQLLQLGKYEINGA